MTTTRPLHMRQPCGCGLDLHGHSWEHIIERGEGFDFVYCSTHAAAPKMLRTLKNLVAYSYRDLAEDPAVWKELQEDARALLAKIEGAS